MSLRSIASAVMVAAIVAGLLVNICTAAVFQTGPGRFEIVSTDPVAARVVTEEADAAWRFLAAPLALPDGFSSPIFVRIVSAPEWTDRAPFHVVVEAGGVVSVR